jgi:FdhE protein
MARSATDPVAPRVRARFEGLAVKAPEARAWLALVDEVLREAASGAWGRARVSGGAPEDGVPQLARAHVTVPGAVAARWLTRLLHVAGEHGGTGLAALRGRAGAVDPATLLSASLRSDPEAIACAARDAGADPQAFAQVAHLAVVPLLLALRASGALRPVGAWRSGPCPGCGAFALVAESRGLARDHRLRCGRCGADGAGAELTCVFCGKADHQRLRHLVPDGNPQARRVLACLACNGYLRVIPTLAALDAEALLLEDLAHVDLDMAASGHGYRRPAPPVLPDVAVTLDPRAGL